MVAAAFLLRPRSVAIREQGTGNRNSGCRVLIAATIRRHKGYSQQEYPLPPATGERRLAADIGIVPVSLFPTGTGAAGTNRLNERRNAEGVTVDRRSKGVMLGARGTGSSFVCGRDGECRARDRPKRVERNSRFVRQPPKNGSLSSALRWKAHPCARSCFARRRDAIHGVRL